MKNRINVRCVAKRSANLQIWLRIAGSTLVTSPSRAICAVEPFSAKSTSAGTRKRSTLIFGPEVLRKHDKNKQKIKSTEKLYMIYHYNEIKCYLTRIALAFSLLLILWFKYKISDEYLLLYYDNIMCTYMSIGVLLFFYNFFKICVYNIIFDWRINCYYRRRSLYYIILSYSIVYA